MMSKLNWSRQTVDLDTLFNNIKKGRYWMDPPHQRDVVHSDNWQSKIMESHMKGYLVPSATFDMYTDEQCTRFRSIDGKQRTMAVFRYIDDQYAYMCSFPDYMTGKKFSQLTKKEKDQLLYKEATLNIANRQLTDEEIEDMFSRMQETKKTSLGELLNSRQMTSPIIRHINTFMTDLNPLFKKADTRNNRLELVIRMEYSICALHDNENSKIDVSRSKLLNWTKIFEIKNIPAYSMKLIKCTLNILQQCKTTHSYQKTFVLPLLIVLGKYIVNKQTSKISKNKYDKFCKFVREKEIIYPQVGGSHSATDTRIPILEEMYQQYNER